MFRVCAQNAYPAMKIRYMYLFIKLYNTYLYDSENIQL